MRKYVFIAGLALGLMPALLRADSTMLLTSFYPLRFSNDVAEFDVTVHGIAGGTSPANYLLSTTQTFGLTVEVNGNVDQLVGGGTVIDAKTVRFTSFADMTFLESNVEAPVNGDPFYFDKTNETLNFSVTSLDHSIVYWTDTESLVGYFYWEFYNGFANGRQTFEYRPPETKHIQLDIYLGGLYADQDPPPGGACKCCGMAGYSFDMLHGSLMVNDTPINYQPPLGPGVSFSTTYNQVDLGQFRSLPVSSVGLGWTYNALTYIANDPDSGASPITRFVPGGGVEHYSDFEVDPSTPGFDEAATGMVGSNQTSAPERNSRAVLNWNPVTQTYTRVLPDGSSETYSYKVTDSTGTICYLITSQTDSQGNTITYAYDSQNRLANITDALGQKTTFAYSVGSNPYLISQVTDPFGRSVHFTYDKQGRLRSATDPVGIVSSYKYDSTNFLNALTTPYGTTTFSTDSDSYHQAVQATNPLGQTERVELRSNSVSGIADSETTTPSGITYLNNSGLSQNNTYYWDRRQYTNPPVYTNAKITHWMTGPRGLINIPDSVKQPLEGRVWYNYNGQTAADYLLDSASANATVTARVLDDSSTQAAQASYTSTGLITQSIDPLGRTTNYTYAGNGIDLTQVAQVNGSGQDVLSTLTYNSQHEPLTVTDASGQVTTMTYNSAGQLLTRTNAKGQTTTLAYDGNGYLASVTGPESGAVTSYTYDSVGRVHTVTDSEGYVVTTAYDNLDRPVTVTYPDGTTDQTHYDGGAYPLDVAHTIDRQGRVTANQYDAIRELVQTTDPLGRVTRYGWCTCGGLATLTDANGNVTTWNHDLQGRVTSKVYADSSQVTYAFESSTSRLHQMTDAVGNSAVYAYNEDNTLASTTYTPASGVSATPNVSFTYDTVYNRVTGMTDGAGTTSYTYNAITGSVTTGAGRLASVSVPIAGSTAAVTYSYDELGRVTGRGVDAATTNANNVSTTFDDLGRVTSVSNALGAFTYAYVDATSRLSEVTYPNGQKTDYSYFGNTGDQRLQEIKNYISGMISNTPLSKFDYTYNPVGTIATWQQQADSDTPTSYALSYDAADQLINAVQTNTSTSATVSSNAYNYDPSGNRLAETTQSATTAGEFNTLNQLTRYTSVSGTQTVAGNTSAAVSSVTVNAVPATVTESTNFTANVPLQPGTNTISVVAQPSGTASPTTKRYQLVTSGTAASALTYDANGNTLTDENGNTYQWDALNRLTQITYPSGASSLFAYDGLSRRISIIEKNSSGTVTSTKNYLWIGSEMAEERDASDSVTKRFFSEGEQQAGTAYYYTRDHLSSVREMMDESGTIQARYSYDPYGRQTKVSGSLDSTFQFTGDFYHAESSLNMTWFRAYNSDTGRWLPRDPWQENGGSNLYDYVGNDPIDYVDYLGLSPCTDACWAKFQKALRENWEEAALIGAGLGGGAQTVNKSAIKPRGGVAGGGPSGKYTSYSRNLSGGKSLGRTPVPIIMAFGAAVGVATLEAIDYYYYHDCVSKCKNSCPSNDSGGSPVPPSSPLPSPLDSPFPITPPNPAL